MQDGSTVDVDMMNSTFSSNYAANDCYATLELPFGENERWSFYALLPNEGKSVKDIMTMLDKNRWELNKQSLHTEMVNIKLPKFKSEMELELKRPLISLGATTMFTQDADFSLMTPDKELLYTSTIMQNVYLKIDEEGAEAAAVTHEYMVGAHIDDNAKSVSVINFHANHPFIYMIQDKRSGAISFMGLYNGI
jgi:serpin B